MVYSPEKIRRILIRSTNWLGDAVMTVPALRAVRETFPDAHITVMARSLVSELLSPLECIDAFLVYDRATRIQAGKELDCGSFLSAVKAVRSGRFDLAVLLQNAIEAALLSFFGGVPRRIGYSTDGRGFLLTGGVVVRPETLRLHHKDYYLEMLSNFGICTARPSDISIPLPQDWKNSLKCLVPDAFLADNVPIVGINPGAHFGSAKRWGEEKFAKVADDLAAEFGTKTIITGGGREVEIAFGVEKNMSTPCLNLAGKTSLPQLVAVVDLCRLFVTNDSGPMHIAAARGKDIVAIFGSTDPTTTSPVSKKAVIVRREMECSPCLKRQCSQKHHNCMRLLSPDGVTEAARGILREDTKKKDDGVRYVRSSQAPI